MVPVRPATPLLEPTTDAAGDETLRSPEVAQADLHRVDPVQAVEHIDDGARHLTGLGRRQLATSSRRWNTTPWTRLMT